jgi:hypothetical protein
MTVNTTTPLNEYLADGIVDTFNYDFKTLRLQDMSVFIDGSAAGDPFTVTGLGSDSGGTVVFDSPPGASVTVRLERVTIIERTTDFIEGGPLSSSVLDTDLDVVVMALQEIDRRTVQEAPGGGDPPVTAKYS